MFSLVGNMFTEHLNNTLLLVIVLISSVMVKEKTTMEWFVSVLRILVEAGMTCVLLSMLGFILTRHRSGMERLNGRHFLGRAVR